jgi:Fe-S-cluster containining protein
MINKLILINSLISIKPTSRRQLILLEMENLKHDEINCHQCRGPCCTFESNSMQITPLEALDIINYLSSVNRINADLIFHLQETNSQYRLNQFVGNGKSFLRKTFTCPFFEEGVKGCTISRNNKPIGCLGFNPIEKNITNGGSCKSNVKLLEDLAVTFQKEEKEINTKIKSELKIFWDKAPIPVAVLEVLLAIEGD